MAILAAVAPTAQAEAPETGSVGPAGRVGPPMPLVESETIGTGFVFINGRYVPPPYTVIRTEDQVLVNGTVVETIARTSGDDVSGGWSERDGGRGSSEFRRVVDGLGQDEVVVVFDGAPIAFLNTTDVGGDFLQALISNDVGSPCFDGVLSRLPDGADVGRWRDWVKSYEPPPDFLQRANSILQEIEAIETENFRQISAVRRLDSLLYGLTITTMVVAVVALGHLLSFRPPINARWRDVDSSPEATQMVVRLVALVVVMSGFDLAWTLLSSGNGHFRELNPLGSQLLGSPAFLTAFKTVSISTSGVLLFALRRFRGAQTASWWLCLVCTVVTFRWLMYDSMFLS